MGKTLYDVVEDRYGDHDWWWVFSNWLDELGFDNIPADVNEQIERMKTYIRECDDAGTDLEPWSSAKGDVPQKIRRAIKRIEELEGESASKESMSR
jgi:hypothetical protein